MTDKVVILISTSSGTSIMELLPTMEFQRPTFASSHNAMTILFSHGLLSFTLFGVTNDTYVPCTRMSIFLVSPSSQALLELQLLGTHWAQPRHVLILAIVKSHPEGHEFSKILRKNSLHKNKN